MFYLAHNFVAVDINNTNKNKQTKLMEDHS